MVTLETWAIQDCLAQRERRYKKYTHTRSFTPLLPSYIAYCVCSVSREIQVAQEDQAHLA